MVSRAGIKSRPEVFRPLRRCILIRVAPPQDDLDRLGEVLSSSVSWPAVYTFKFIVPRGSANRLVALLDGLPFTERSSRRGRYIGITVTARMDSSDAVLAVYRRAAAVEGLLAF